MSKYNPSIKNSLSAQYFDNVYNQNEDPWDFENSAYETSKYQATIAALPKEIYQQVFEIGCSIGVLTKMLVPKCVHLLAVEPADKAFQKAKNRVKDFSNVHVEKMLVPNYFPNQQFDLILLSEVGYYLSKPDLEKLAELMIAHLLPDGQLLLVHWTPFVPDYPQTGDEVHDYFMNLYHQKKHLKHVKYQREEKFRLDLFEKL